MEPEQKSNSALVGLIIIVIILIIGGIYLWKNKAEVVPEGTTDTTVVGESTLEIEANLNNVDIESTDSEI